MFRTRDYEHPVSNPVLRSKNVGQVVFILHCSSSPSCKIGLTVVDMCKNSLRALIATYVWTLIREVEVMSD